MEWISVKDKLMPYGVNVLIYTPGYKGRPVREGMLTHTNASGHQYTDAQGFGICGVSHWMPLPDAPRSEYGKITEGEE